jgi:hypothetical protein
VDYRGLVKSLDLPSGFVAPAELAYENIRARAISRADLREDVRGINASIDIIQRTRGGGWPTEPVTEDFNYVDLVWHELEFRDGHSFTYAVYDVDVSWWVTPSAYDKGYYTKLYAALQQWVTRDYPFTMPYYSNTEIPNP